MTITCLYLYTWYILDISPARTTGYHLYVLGLRGLSPPENKVEAPEDVLRQVDTLGSLRNTSQGHRRDSARQKRGKTAATRQSICIIGITSCQVFRSDLQRLSCLKSLDSSSSCIRGWNDWNERCTLSYGERKNNRLGALTG